jgi:hypothetical protein
VDRQQQINHLLGYTINLVHKIQEYIDYMYHYMSRLAMSGVYEFYMEHQMLIVLNSLHEEWMLMRLSLEYRLKFLDFNNLTDVLLLEREHQYTKKGIQCTIISVSRLDVATKFISWFEHNKL